MSRLRPQALAAKARLAEGFARQKERHDRGAPGVEVCAALSDLRDEAVRALFDGATDDLGADRAAIHRQAALVLHSGSGRRDVAPFSDVDLMVLHEPAAAGIVAPVVERLLCDVFDAGLALGHSVRTPQEALALAFQDATILSALLESRLLAGSAELVDGFLERFRRQVRRRASAALAALEQARQEERIKFGDTVYLLEPNVKKSPGGLREVHMLRWVAAVRYGTADLADLAALGLISDDDRSAAEEAGEFLLRVRNELHFAAGKPGDVLDRAAQLRIAALRGYESGEGMLPVERFMRDYFRHSDRLSRLAGRLLGKARWPRRGGVFWAALLGHRAGGGFIVGPRHIVATRRGLKSLRGNLPAIMELVSLANLHRKQLAPETWDAIRRQVPAPGAAISAEAVRQFWDLLANAGQLGALLRSLHEIELLERFIPAFEHARGLLQFNQYHKYTVDEHSFRAVDQATELINDSGPLGRVYRSIPDKRVLHLALLIHDLGKGHPGDHCEVGRDIARDTAARLGLDRQQTETLEFLVLKHLRMNHLAFRRDTSDEQLIVRFAVEAGSPEALKMLYVLTCCDLAAVGPWAWNTWKAEVLAELYHRTMRHLAGESPSTSREESLEGRRAAIRAALGNDAPRDWFVRHLALLPVSYLDATDPAQAAEDLRLLEHLGPGEVKTLGRYQGDTHTVRFTVGTSEQVAPGIFHRLTGALTGQGLEILSAEINTLADGLVLDRFWVQDPDFAGEPPPERLEGVCRALAGSLSAGGPGPTFRRTWTSGGAQPASPAARQTRVRVDNTTSGHCTILDIFTLDRRGLLFAVTRTLFELDLSVTRAKIGTFLDQVVDVFYVTDRQGAKIEDQERLEAIRQRLLEVIDAGKEPG